MSDKFEFIDAEYAANTITNTEPALPITKMCALLEVSRSGFYEWRGRPASATAERREELKLFIAKSFDESDGTYPGSQGHRRAHPDHITKSSRPTPAPSQSRIRYRAPHWASCTSVIRFGRLGLPRMRSDGW